MSIESITEGLDFYSMRDAFMNLRQGYLLHRLNKFDWFVKFIDDAFDKKYPVDRFAIWVGIFLVARECDHKQAQNICSAMFNQIPHQETNSCQMEEMLQLSQLGSISLSYHKQFSDMPLINDTDSATEVDDNQYDFSSEDTDSLGDKTSDRNQILRRVLDDELLRGNKCSICEYQPTEVLEPLRWSCPDGCLYGRKVHYPAHCSISFRPIDMVPIRAVLGPKSNMKRILLLSCSEWARKFTATITDTRSDTSTRNSNSNTVVEERVDISSKFERLTVLRRRAQPEEEQDDSDQDDNPSAGDTVNLDDRNQVRSSDMSVLNGFIQSKRLESTSRALSESVRVVHFLGKGFRGTVPMCIDELFAVDSIGEEDLINVYLMLRQSMRSHGKIWVCNKRSELSKLMIGCGQFFQSSALTSIGLGRASSSNCSSRPECPNCGHELDVIVQLSNMLG